MKTRDGPCVPITLKIARLTSEGRTPAASSAMRAQNFPRTFRTATDAVPPLLRDDGAAFGGGGACCAATARGAAGATRVAAGAFASRRTQYDTPTFATVGAQSSGAPFASHAPTVKSFWNFASDARRPPKDRIAARCAAVGVQIAATELKSRRTNGVPGETCARALSTV